MPTKPSITVTTAHALTTEQQAQVREVLRQRAGAVAVEFVVNPAVLGGVQVKLGSQTFDASLDGTLRSLDLGVESVMVVSAVPLTAKQRTLLNQTIEKKYGVRTLQEVVDPTVLGGIKVIIGSTEYDSTISGKLNKLKQAALAAM